MEHGSSIAWILAIRKRFVKSQSIEINGIVYISSVMKHLQYQRKIVKRIEWIKKNTQEWRQKALTFFSN